MLAKISLEHSAYVQIRRRRHSENFVFPDTVEAHIACVDLAAFPVALRFPGPLGLFNTGLQTVEIRTFDGRLYRPVGAGIDWLAESAATKRRTRFPFASRASLDRRRLPVADDAEIVRIHASNKEERRAEVREWAYGALLCDGVLWEPAPEPVLVADTRNLRFSIDETGDRNPPLGITIPFRIDEGDFARDWIKCRLGRDITHSPGIETTEAYAPSFDSSLRRLRTTGRELSLVPISGILSDTPSARLRRLEEEIAKLYNRAESLLAAEYAPRYVDILAEACQQHRDDLKKCRNGPTAFKIAACEAEIESFRASRPEEDPDLISFAQ